MSTIVLVHGLWVTPRSWEAWVPYLEGKGHTVVTPAYPGFEVEVEALRADTTPIATVTVPETIAHLEKVIAALPEKLGKQETGVDFHNEERAPLLFIAGGADHIMPPSVNKSNAHH